MTLVPTDESQEIIEQIWRTKEQKKDLRWKTDVFDDYDEKYMKIIYFYLKIFIYIELRNIIIVVTAVFHEDNKYYSQLFVDEFCISCKC